MTMGFTFWLVLTKAVVFPVELDSTCCTMGVVLGGCCVASML